MFLRIDVRHFDVKKLWKGGISLSRKIIDFDGLYMGCGSSRTKVRKPLKTNRGPWPSKGPKVKFSGAYCANCHEAIAQSDRKAKPTNQGIVCGRCNKEIAPTVLDEKELLWRAIELGLIRDIRSMEVGVVIDHPSVANHFDSAIRQLAGKPVIVNLKRIEDIDVPIIGNRVQVIPIKPGATAVDILMDYIRFINPALKWQKR